MAGILASLLSLFGLGGCKEPEAIYEPDPPQILDGPGMEFDPASMYLEKYSNQPWVDPISGQTLSFTRETLTIREGDTVLWEGPWQIDTIDYSNHIAVSTDGQPMGGYSYFAADYFKWPENAQPDYEYLAAYPVDRASDEEYVLFRRSK